MPKQPRGVAAEPGNERGGRSQYVVSGLLAAGLLLTACGGQAGSSSSNSPQTNKSASDIRGLPATLSAITCASETDCWAVGTYKTGTSTRTLIEQNTGNGWRIVSSPTVSPADSLVAVTCVGAQECWAVGAYGTSDGGKEPLIEQNTGKGWTVFRSPTPGGSHQKSLSSVSCADANDCWAVGTAGIERYARGSWTIVDNATPDAVSCAVPSDCLAVSSDGIEQYGGSVWSAVTVPNVGHLGLLLGVTCASVDECWAVGSTAGGAATRALILAYAGGEWKVVRSSVESLSFNLLGAVTCISTDDCWTVGQFDQAGVSQTLVVHFTAGGWTVVKSPNAGTRDNTLLSVACPSSNDCWAVGGYTGTPGSQALIEHYDGTTWSVVS